ncbi:hypothetical protein Bhyg_02813 [Pseudolycoriella hygida]|uniref:Uncharacterized protein n=1 Tax=Pseudolycoriella hygida TaxID=35572 RepID=A0A9Q0S8X3_9DIPT|nr:hypothetical protein Bhyg_02813 [Pseudolycoriella hygida]
MEIIFTFSNSIRYAKLRSHFSLQELLLIRLQCGAYYDFTIFCALVLVGKVQNGRRQNDGATMRRTHDITIKIENSDDDDEIHITDDAEKSAASGSDEDDSLLVAYDSNSVASV